MSSIAPDARDVPGARLGGARADFVASLGRKVGDARELLAALEEDLSSKTARDELRRRLHALGSGARLLRFDSMAQSLQEALAALDHGAQAGGLREQELVFVGRVLDDLPALAWGETPVREAARPADDAGETASHMPISILIVGGDWLADALTDDGAMRARSFECERTEDIETALELARAYAPDLVVVDADLLRAPELVEALLDDPLTEPVPVTVVGTFRATEESSRFLALGVAKLLSKPVAPEALRRACDDILDAREGRTMRITLGEPTVEQLAERLSSELKRALVDSVDGAARSCRVPLGEGTEVMGALWGAIARVQEIVSQKTGGAVRFGGDAPEGAIALAPWLHQDLPGADRMVGRGRGAGADVRLRGRRVVVADDDPGVTWFISDLLRTAGCEVYEALDGNTALDLAFRVQPELVVSDILMPGLDGFALCRALRRDVALRDTPVILLSWKEDLLQRVRELGASAAAYMRKESDSRAILARVREVLRPRARIETRLKSNGEVRGRLDGLSPRLLLDLVCVISKNACVSVRDATFLYEIDIRGGMPRKATRTASDGSYQSGERALGSLLAVGAGRFVVSPTVDPVRGDLSGTLFDLLARPIANARGALAATTGARTMNVEHIGLDEVALDEYLRATPDPARALIRRLARGASPRQMLLGGEVSPSLLEDVLADLSARDAVRAVVGPNGVDLLTPAVASAMAVLKATDKPRGSASSSAPPAARFSAPAPPVATTRSIAPAPVASIPAPAYESNAPPSSLEDAVMREISDRSPAPGASRSSGSDPPPIIEPSELKRRSSNPPSDDESDEGLLPSIPPDAIVPGAASSDEMAIAPVVTHDVIAPLPVVEVVPVPRPAARLLNAETLEPQPQYESPFAARSITTRGVQETPAPSERPVPLPVAPPEPVETGDPKKRSGWLLFLTFAVLATAVGAALRASGRSEERRSRTAIPAATATPTPTPTATTTATPTPTATATATTTATTTTTTTTTATPPPSDEIPPGAEVPAGYGLISVEAPAGAHVRVDGAVVGVGPMTSSVAAPGYHEVRVQQGGHELKSVVEVRAGKTTHAGSTLLP
jgi:DNA-binding response OmpR family regulator